MTDSSKMHPAAWWKSAPDGAVDCLLCPRACRIKSGQAGFCLVRVNVDGKLFSTAYGYPVALNVDPIEKKPLSNFMQGTKTFSLGTFGCNLDCCFCQNASLSRGSYDQKQNFKYFSPETMVEMAFSHNCQSIAFTYNEPTIFGEYVLDTAKIAKERDLATVMVTNGYITPQAARDIYPYIDAANIDMKGFSDEFYSSMTKTRLKPVLKSIKYFYDLGKHLELTNLVIPGYNDSEEMLTEYLDWVEAELDQDVPLHFSAFHPDHLLKKIAATPRETLFRIRDFATARGFKSIQLGNIIY
jgi:pyruvate formate lyase activating enzyme